MSETDVTGSRRRKLLLVFSVGSKGLTLLLLGEKDGERPMRVAPWNQYQLVDQEADPALQLASLKNRLSRSCASLRCSGCTFPGIESPSPLKVESVQHQDISRESRVSEKVRDHTSETDNNKEALKLSLRSSLKRLSVTELLPLEDKKKHGTLTVDGSNFAGNIERRKVQWPDACGRELAQVREFEPSEMGLSDDEWEMGKQKSCSCVVM